MISIDIESVPYVSEHRITLLYSSFLLSTVFPKKNTYIHITILASIIILNEQSKKFVQCQRLILIIIINILNNQDNINFSIIIMATSRICLKRLQAPPASSCFEILSPLAL